VSAGDERDDAGFELAFRVKPEVKDDDRGIPEGEAAFGDLEMRVMAELNFL
jgi:hypothetical protein